MTQSPTTRTWRLLAFGLPILVLAALYLITAQSPARAGEEARVFFAELDQNGDSEITIPEVEAFLTAEGWTPDAACGQPFEDPCEITGMAENLLDWVDSDSDGVATFEELSAVILRDRAEEFLGMDHDENGFVTGDELAIGEIVWAIEDPHMAMADGIVISEACMAQFEAEQLAGLAETCGFATQSRIEIAVYDADRDGRVSLREYLDH